MLTLGLQSSQTQTWYGPVRVEFNVPVVGNPYDGQDNDVIAIFDGPSPERRIAFFDQDRWVVQFLAKKPGAYRVRLQRNGRGVANTDQRINVPGTPLAKGFIRVDKAKNRFRFDDGSPYFPIGHNFGWHLQSHNLEDHFRLMANSGINWTRIWANGWDSKNPYVLREGRPRQVNTMDPVTLENWDRWVSLAESNQIRFQFVLFHHGLFSTQVNPNWNDHPWNRVNGGFLRRPHDFFTDAYAKRLTRNWLRYAVARWGHSRSIMAWELFNEVEWVDPIHIDKQPETVVAWHKEMAQYLRSIDPYGRLVTTSSEMEIKGLYDSMDYYQPHAYPQDVRARLAEQRLPQTKPLFFGEIGGARFEAKAEPMIVRDSLWVSTLAGHPGAAAYWYWDRMWDLRMYPIYRRFVDLIQPLGLAGDHSFRPVSATMETENRGDLVLAMGKGWGETTKFELDVPQGATPANLGQISSYLQSQTSGGNSRLFSRPLTLRSNQKEPGNFVLQVGSVAKAGANLRISVNGRQVVNQTWRAQSEDRTLDQDFTVPLPAGPVTIVIGNQGADWLTINRIVFPGLGEGIIQAMQDGQRTIGRVTQAAGATVGGRMTIKGLSGLRQGTIALHDLDSTASANVPFNATAEGGTFVSPYRDFFFVLGSQDANLRKGGSR
jgi:hypothetical protein